MSAFVVLLITVAFTVGSASGEALGSSWTSSTNYFGRGIYLQSCVPSADFDTLYCVGGFNGATYLNIAQYAPLLSSGGAGEWVNSTAYPLSVSGESCVALAGDIYCIGGSSGGNSRTTDVYYAQPSLSGVGPWTAAAPYPLDVQLQSCVAYDGGIYCVGGYTHLLTVSPANYTQYTNETYFAVLSASGGLGTWARSTGYPVLAAGESCVTYSSYVYCVGGDTGYTGIANNVFPGTNRVYYAPLSSSGIGAWTSTTPYPMAAYGGSCVVQYDYVYCVGGYTKSGYTANAYYASLSPSGVGTWVQTTSYPVDVVEESCTTFSVSINCAGGLNPNSVISEMYSNGVASLTPETVTATSTTTATSTDTVTKTSTTTLQTTVNNSVTLTSTSVVKTVSSVTSTKTITKTKNSTKTVTSTSVSRSTQTVDQQQPQTQPGPAGSLLQVVPLALGAAVGVGVTFAALRLGRRRKNSAPAAEV